MIQWVVTLGALAAFFLGLILLAKLWRNRFSANAKAFETWLKTAPAPLAFIVQILYWFSMYAVVALIAAALNLVHLLPAELPKPMWWVFIGLVMGVLQPAVAALWNKPAEPEDWLTWNLQDDSNRNAP